MYDRGDDLLMSIRQAARRLRRDGRFAAFVILTLAIGIGLNATMVGVVDRLLLRGPAGIRDSRRVVRLYHTEIESSGYVSTSAAFDYAAYDQAFRGTHAFSGIAAYTPARNGTLGRGAAARQVAIEYVSPNFFDVLGARAAVGREFSNGSGSSSDNQDVVVLGYGLWQREFGGSPAVLGRVIRIADHEYTIIGVSARGFSGAELAPVDVWLPISVMGANLSPDWKTAWDAPWTWIVGRLAPGATRAAAAVEATSRFRLAYAGVDRPTAHSKLTIGSLTQNWVGKWSQEAFVSACLICLCIALLVIACANVANLTLARAMRGRREVAVRIALGASRGQVLLLFAAEAAVLAIASAAVALGISSALGAVLQHQLLPDVEWGGATPGMTVVAATVIITIVVAIAIGMLPAIRVSRADITETLKSGEDKGSGRAGWFRSGISVSQSALSVILLIVATAFVRSLWNARAIDYGVQPGAFLVATIEWPRSPNDGASNGQAEGRRRRALFESALREIRALPDVESAAVSMGLPFLGASRGHVRVPGGAALDGSKAPLSYAVSDDYFRTVGTHLVRGRPFSAADQSDGQRVVIVSDVLARTLWPNADPVGHCLLVGSDTLPCARVVGVAETTRSVRGTQRPEMYVPLEQSAENARMILGIRPRAGSTVPIATIRNVLLRNAPDLDYVDIRPLQRVIDPAERPWRLGAMMFCALGAVAAMVAGIGLFSVVGYLVAQRRREIGIRLALGAQSSSVLRLMMSSGLRVALAGEAIGVVVALAFGRFLDPLLFKTSAHDPLTIGGAAVAMFLIAALGTFASALRSTSIQPVEALRGE